jgi:hypothetical protein
MSNGIPEDVCETNKSKHTSRWFGVVSWPNQFAVSSLSLVGVCPLGGHSALRPHDILFVQALLDDGTVRT